MVCKSFCILPLLFVVLFSACNNSSENKAVVHDTLKGNNTVEVDIKHGKLIYDRNCKVCHQAAGQGIPGYYPPIANTKSSNGDKGYLIKVLLYGLSGKITVEGKDYNGVMANYRNLSDKDIASVLNYIRSLNGKELEPVSPEDVKKIR